MKAVSFILVFLSFTCFAQTKERSCLTIYRRANELFKQGHYELALNKLAAYKLCDPTKAGNADSLILQVYQTINKQKTEAIIQKDIANNRAKIIEKQRDSLSKENIANRLATEALQVNELNPSRALNTVLTGLCFSPNNSALTEIRRKILNSEVLFSNIKGASVFNTTRIKQLNGSVLITADGEGKIKFWNSETKQITNEIRTFTKSITEFEVINYNYLLVIGKDVSSQRSSVDQIKLVEIASSVVSPIIDDSATTYTAISALGDSNTVYLGDQRGIIKKFSLSTKSIETIAKDTGKIIGLQCWRNVGKIFYATPFGVGIMGTSKRIYSPPEHSFVTYLGLCQSTCDLYIGMGEDLVLLNYPAQKEQLLYPIHKSLITSCHCSENSGGFMTTSLDKYAALWTSNGNLKQTLKGNNAELYDGYLNDDAKFAITVGRREMNAGANNDTNTAKFWYLKGFNDKIVSEAHRFGVTSIINIQKEDLFVSAGNDGTLRVWNSSLNPVTSKRITADVINTLEWDAEHQKIYYGTSSGEIGFVKVGVGFRLSEPTSMKYHKAAASAIEIDNDIVYSAGKDGVIYTFKGNKCLDSLLFDAEINSISLSEDHTQILIALGKNAIVYNFKTKHQELYKHEVSVNGAQWISKNMFATISGQFLRLWNENRHDGPCLRVDNNIKNVMTSMCVDALHQFIYTGTWSGYIICWDYTGKQLFEFDQLTSLANTNIIQSICPNKDKSKILTVDYNGNIASWFSPISFFEKQLNLKVNCDNVLSDFQMEMK